MLVLDTSTERGLLAWLQEENLVFVDFLPQGHHASHFLAARLQEQLALSGLTPKHIEAIATGIGPGSYTGLRVAAIFGKTLSYALGVPLVGVCSLEGFVPSTHVGSFIAAIDARGGGIYAMEGSQDSQGNITFKDPPALWTLEQFQTHLEQTDLVVSPHVEILKRRLTAPSSLLWEERAPCPIALAKKAKAALSCGHASYDGSLELLYLK